MTKRPIRLAVRGIVMREGRLLMVNAWKNAAGGLWCAPGGGAEPHQSLPENLAREIYEETGLTVAVGAPCLVNEFHNPQDGFHQVDVYFRCTVTAGELSDTWKDPEDVVTHRAFFSREELAAIRHKPDSLAEIAWGVDVGYDALEMIVKP